jgi:hypothetical protein
LVFPRPGADYVAPGKKKKKNKKKKKKKKIIGIP